MPHTEFDEYAQSYDEILEECLGGAGSQGAVDYFSRGKALYLARLLGQNFRGRVLDYGCGHGRVARDLLEMLPGATVHGYDVSEKTIASTDAALRQRAMLTSSQDDLAPSYDLILAAGVLHHVPPSERKNFMTSLSSKLAPGGHLVIFEHNPLNPFTRRVVKRCIFDRGVTLSPASSTCELLVSVGLRVARRDYIAFIPPVLSFLRAV